MKANKDLYLRRGKFVVSREFIFADLENFAKVLNDFVALNIDMNLATDDATYYGMHPSFDKVSEYQIYPTYQPWMETNFNGDIIKIRWERIA